VLGIGDIVPQKGYARMHNQKAQRVAASDPTTWSFDKATPISKSVEQIADKASALQELIKKGKTSPVLRFLFDSKLIAEATWYDSAKWSEVEFVLKNLMVTPGQIEDFKKVWTWTHDQIKAMVKPPTVTKDDESTGFEDLSEWVLGWRIANKRLLQSEADRLENIRRKTRQTFSKPLEAYNPLRPLGTVLSDTRAKEMLKKLQRRIGALSPEQRDAMRSLQEQLAADQKAEATWSELQQLKAKAEKGPLNDDEMMLMGRLQSMRHKSVLNSYQLARLKRYEKIAEKHKDASPDEKKLLSYLRKQLGNRDRKLVNAELRELFRTVWAGKVIVLYPSGPEDLNSWAPAYDFVPEPTPERLIKEYQPAAQLRAASGANRSLVTDLDYIAAGMPDPTDPQKVVITYNSFYLACLRTAKLLHKNAHNRRLDDVIVDTAQHLVGDLYYALLAWETGDVYDRTQEVLVDQDDQGQRRLVHYRKGREYRWSAPESLGVHWKIRHQVKPRTFTNLWIYDKKERFPDVEKLTTEDQIRYEAFIEKATLMPWPKRNDEGEVEGLTYPQRFLMMARASSYQLFGELYGKAPSLRVGGGRRQGVDYLESNPVYARESGPFAEYTQDGLTVRNVYLQAGITIIGNKILDEKTGFLVSTDTESTQSRVRAGSKSGRNLSGNDNREEDITWYDKQGKPHKGMIPRDINPFDQVSKVEVTNRVTGATITTTSVRKWVERAIESDGSDPEMRPIRDRKTAIFESVDIHNKAGNLVEGIESSTLKARQGSASKNSDGSDPVQNAIRREERMLLRILRRVMWTDLTEVQQKAMLRIIRTGVHSETTTEERLWKRLIGLAQLRMTN